MSRACYTGHSVAGILVIRPDNKKCKCSRHLGRTYVLPRVGSSPIKLPESGTSVGIFRSPVIWDMLGNSLQNKGKSVASGPPTTHSPIQKHQCDRAGGVDSAAETPDGR